jgi:hypothetical protein
MNSFVAGGIGGAVGGPDGRMPIQVFHQMGYPVFVVVAARVDGGLVGDASLRQQAIHLLLAAPQKVRFTPIQPDTQVAKVGFGIGSQWIIGSGVGTQA